jgi:uncharacterized damage-inducible protein DinB
MNCADILDLYRYNGWANERIASSVLTLSREAFTRHLGGSYPTIRDAYSHIVSVEWVWLERWTGTSPAAAPVWAASAEPALLAEHLREVDARRYRFLSGLSADELDAPVSFVYLSGAAATHRLQDLLVHVANHSTYHRGQVSSMLRQVGTVPPSTDFIVYRRETSTDG